MPTRSSRKIRSRRAAGRAMLCAALAALTWAALGQAPAVRPEYDVKAAYVLNFTRYVSWPETVFDAPDAPIVICILGRDPFGDSIDRIMRDRTSHGRRLHVRRIDEGGSVDECQLLFMDVDTDCRHAVLQDVRDKPILTVGEGRRFVREGGAIGLVIQRDTVQFRVNLLATRDTGLEISSRMLGLAEEVLTKDGDREAR